MARWSGSTAPTRRVLLAATFDEEGREITPPRAVPYDTLVIAIGSVTNDFGTPGAARYAVPLETAEQAARFNRRLVNACIRAHTQEEPVAAGQLHVAIIGAGATGTELAAELHHTARQVVAFGLDRIDPDKDIRIILIEAADRILPALPAAHLGGDAGAAERLGVVVRAGAKVSEVKRRRRACWTTASSSRSELVVWCAGVEGAGRAARSRRARDQPHQPAGGDADAADDARSPTSSPSATAPPARGRAMPARCRRAPRRRTSRPRICCANCSAGSPARRSSLSSIAISARWCRWASTPPSAA